MRLQEGEAYTDIVVKEWEVALAPVVDATKPVEDATKTKELR